MRRRSPWTVRCSTRSTSPASPCFSARTRGSAGSLSTNEAILRYPGIDGVFSFYNGNTIEEARAIGDIPSAIYRLNLEQLLALRDVLQS